MSENLIHKYKVEISKFRTLALPLTGAYRGLIRCRHGQDGANYQTKNAHQDQIKQRKAFFALPARVLRLLECALCPLL